MKHLNTYENKSFNMKPMSSYITEYIIKKKLDKPIDSEYQYVPKTKQELIENLNELISKDIYDFNCINTSAITDMSYLFKGICIDRNFNVSDWNVSNVTNMQEIFYNCKEFNCDLSNWDVSKVINMRNMFCNCYKFNCDLSKWDVSNVKDMSYMFSICISFTGKGLENWNVSKTIWMNLIFYKCKNLNCDFSNWDVSNCVSFSNMFNECGIFDCDLSNWDVSKAKDMNGMFTLCENFKGKGLENWDVSNVENMSYMFCNCYNFNCDLSNWKINKCEDFTRIFANCKNFNIEYVESWSKNIKTWVNKDSMFYGMKNKPSWYKK